LKVYTRFLVKPRNPDANESAGKEGDHQEGSQTTHAIAKTKTLKSKWGKVLEEFAM